MRERQHICIVGLGNEYRRDDGAGIRIAREIAAMNWPGVTARAVAAGDTASLLSAWEGTQTAYLVDAVRAEAAPGTIVRLNRRHLTTPNRPRFLSSHGLDLEQAIALGAALGMLPERVIIYGIVGRDFEPGQGLSPEVEHAAREVIRRLKRGMLATQAFRIRQVEDCTLGRRRLVVETGRRPVSRQPDRPVGASTPGALGRTKLMHEQSLMRALVSQVATLAKQHGAWQVRKVVVRTGALSHGGAEHLEEHFRRAAQGTVLADAILEVESTEELIDLALATVELETPET